MALSRIKYPIFWCIEPHQQAALLRYNYEVHGTVLSPPLPPGTSQAVWDNTWEDSREDVDRLMKERPRPSVRSTK